MKPNRSKRIMDRASEEIFKVLISAVVEGTRARRMGMRRRRSIRGNFVILATRMGGDRLSGGCGGDGDGGGLEGVQVGESTNE